MMFEHGVASGDPLADAIVLWTRVTTDADRVDVGWVLARDAELRDVVAQGSAVADAARDHTVHVDVGGLEPATAYHYAFTAGSEPSPVGRTRTLPGDGAQRVRFAMCSCAKFNAGFFNAYARIAEHEGLDFVLHLGDYIYEAANKPPASQTPGADIGRPFDPLGECRTLEEYRTRYAQYRRDPDVQKLHSALPMIATLDDHELADGAWSGGSTEHHPEQHGPWEARRDAALQVRWEWLPARQPDPGDPSRVFRSTRLGGLADLLLLDIRSRRDEPVPDPRMSEPSRSMLGARQRAWLEGELDRSTAIWRLIGTPSIFTRTWTEEPAEPLRTALAKLKLMDEDGAGPDYDQWDGYPVERAALIDRLRADERRSTVLLSGDIHVSMAAEVRDAAGESGAAAAIELTTPSLTSQNLDEKLGVECRDGTILASEDAFVAAHGHVHWCEMASHGYVVIDIDPARVRGEWWHVDTVLQRSEAVSRAAAFEVPRGEARLVAAPLDLEATPQSPCCPTWESTSVRASRGCRTR